MTDRDLPAGIEPGAIAALAEGRHGDPFAVLGPHERGDGRTVVRAFLPMAKGATLVGPGARQLATFEHVADGCSRPWWTPSPGPTASAWNGRAASTRPRIPIPSRPARRRRRPPDRGRAASPPRRRAGRAGDGGRRRTRRPLRRVGAERAARVGGRRFQQLGRPAPSDAPAPRSRDLGAVRAAPRGRRTLQVRGPRGRRNPARPEGRPGGARLRGTAADRLDRGGSPPLPLVGRRVDGGARRSAGPERPDLRLRGASRLLAQTRGPPGDVGLARRDAGPLRPAHGFHAHRTAADHGAPLRRLLGLPAARPVRADGPLRQPGGFRPFRRPLPRRGHRRAARLGAGAFSHGFARARPLRRHGALRAPGPPGGLPPGLEHADLQFRAQRGDRLPGRLGTRMAAALPRGWAARRRRRVHALPRLQPQARRVGAEPIWRAREPRSRGLPEAPERHRPPRGAGRHHGGGGIDGVAGRLRTAGGRRPRLPLQMEHGLDARHARLCRARSHPPHPPSRRTHLRPRLRLLREVHAAAQPRRGGARQALDLRPHAGRRVAALRKSQGLLRLHVDPSRQRS